jgi:hypothetical protein
MKKETEKLIDLFSKEIEQSRCTRNQIKAKVLVLLKSINSVPKGIKCQFSNWQCTKVGDCPYVKNENIICMDMD